MSARSITSPVASCPAIVPLKLDELSIIRVPVAAANDTVPECGEPSSSVAPPLITIAPLATGSATEDPLPTDVVAVKLGAPSATDCRCSVDQGRRRDASASAALMERRRLQGIQNRAAHPTEGGRRHVDNHTESLLNAVVEEMSAIRGLHRIQELVIDYGIVGRIIHCE